MPMFFRETLERILFVLLFCAVTLIGVGIAWEIRIWSDPGHYAQRLLIHDQAQIKKALFTPDDDVKQILLGLIKEEKTEIIVAAFSFTDGDIAQAIIDAYQRGVAVTLVVERTNAEGNYTKVPLFVKAGISVYLYPKSKDIIKGNAKGIMHNKFMIFSNTLGGRQVLWTGSFNFTKSASQFNQENIIIIEDHELVQAYTQDFTRLLDRSDHVHGTVKWPGGHPADISGKSGYWLKSLVRYFTKLLGR